MPTLLAAPVPSRQRTNWRSLVLPKEHGSWSLATEPLALGLLAAPSVAGGWLGLAALAGFLARRPLRLVRREPDRARRHAAWIALVALSGAALAGLGLAFANAGAALAVWLAPTALAGGVFLYFDLQDGGREELAEIAGAAAFACLTGALAAAAGWRAWAAVALLFAMCARAVPTVMFVREYVRAAKTGVLEPVPPMVVALAVVMLAAALAVAGAMPVVVPLALALLATRAAVFLVYPRPRLRARSLGFQELAWGVAYVLGVAAFWSV